MNGADGFFRGSWRSTSLSEMHFLAPKPKRFWKMVLVSGKENDVSLLYTAPTQCAGDASDPEWKISANCIIDTRMWQKFKSAPHISPGALCAASDPMAIQPDSGFPDEGISFVHKALACQPEPFPL